MHNTRHKKMKQMALSGELARQIVHDCGNFLYTVLLKLELAEKFPCQDRSSWSEIKRDAKQLGNRLQEWHQYADIIPSEKRKFSLKRVLREVMKDLPDNAFVLQPSSASVRLISYPIDVKCLCCFLLQTVLRAWGDERTGRTPLSLETEKKEEAVLLRIVGIQEIGAALRRLDCVELLKAGNDPASLLSDACKALALRLDAKIYLEKEAENPVALVLALPYELM